ncbi:MAG: molybdopterin-synthase adenylyltransferase MoeB [Candidatus Latescibacterota bacterium]|nr:MAG: molybdopterin-synthase adenylyltransferase MoeB [Candidatus Latescibacterota bacterium]
MNPTHAPAGVQLSNEELQRYSRHLTLPEVGPEGQKRLKASSVLLVGAGGLGAPLGMYLAAAGVGRLGLVDFDVVDYSNLQRQVTYATDDVGRSKLEVARERLRGINPHVQVDTHELMLESANALEILKPYDVVVDGSDNFPTRYLVNDACVLLRKPNVYGSIFRFEGQASVFCAQKGPCYRCLYEEPPPPGLVPSCAEGGVLGVLPGIVGCIQATETLKLLLEQGEPLIGRLLLFDALAMRFRQLKLRKNPQCVLCGEAPTIRELIDYAEFCGIAPQSPQSQEASAVQGEITPVQLKQRLDQGDALYLLDVREPVEWEICNLDGATLIPLGQLQQRAEEVPRDSEIVVHCKMGGRSARAAALLRQLGYERVLNLAGGIKAWAQTVDPSMPQY